MADLFDMSVAGYGFHITGHLIALIALIVACFAITGYITFRDDSVPHSALEDDRVQKHETSGAAGDFWTYKDVVTLPVGSAAIAPGDVVASIPLVLASGAKIQQIFATPISGLAANGTVPGAAGNDRFELHGGNAAFPAVGTASNGTLIGQTAADGQNNRFDEPMGPVSLHSTATFGTTQTRTAITYLALVYQGGVAMANTGTMDVLLEISWHGPAPVSY